MTRILRHHILFGPAATSDEPTLSQTFHENTKLHPNAPVGGLYPAAYSFAETRAMLSVGRRYERSPRIVLPPVGAVDRSPTDFYDVLKNRRTRRSFGTTPLDLNQISGLLHDTAGITDVELSEDGWRRPLRAAPSAGGLYPGELYLAVCNVRDVEPGLYHYNVGDHALETLRAGDPIEDLSAACHYRESLVQAALVVFFCAVQQRTLRKYGERGYRYVLLDIGHMAQNLCLSCEAAGLSCMTLCGFFDDRVHDLFDLDGVDETAVYVAYVGSRA
jgi:SagB-type dehydrogenase family enzyme